ncbi:MAG: response regulator transcription factor [Bacteroidales bacterium]|nr:response regulator transcription factor [Bacteroidales bacterium]
MTRIILIDSICTPQRALQASRRGIAGYLYLGDRLTERLKGAVTDVLEGGTYYSPTAAAALAEAEHLTDRVLPRLNAYHRAVLRGMAQYQPAAQIAAELGRTTQAIYQVQSYLRGLFDVDTNGALLERAAEIARAHGEHGVFQGWARLTTRVRRRVFEQRPASRQAAIAPLLSLALYWICDGGATAPVHSFPGV